VQLSFVLLDIAALMVTIVTMAALSRTFTARYLIASLVYVESFLVSSFVHEGQHLLTGQRAPPISGGT